MWGVIWYPLRLLDQQGLPGIWASLLMYGSALAVGTLWFRARLVPVRHHPWLLLVMALASGWCNVAFILAVLEGHVVRVILLFYLSPLWATLLGWLILRERVGRWGVVNLVIAMAGALTMLWVPELGFPWPQDRADWYALSSGMAFAVANVLVRHLQTVSMEIKVWINWLGVVLVAVVWVLWQGGGVPATSDGAVVGAITMGLLGITAMTLAVQYGVTHMPVHRSAVILLFELVAGAISSLLLTDEAILPKEWIGGGFIILASYWSARQQHD